MAIDYTGRNEGAEFDVQTVEFVVNGRDGEVSYEKLRIFRLLDCTRLIEEGIAYARWFADNGIDEDERSWFSHAIQLVTLFDQVSHVDKRRSREFDVRQACRYESLKGLLENPTASGQTRVDSLLQSVESDWSESLFEAATYEKPEVQIPVTRLAYERFRDSILEEMVVIRKELEETAEKVVHDEMRDRLQQPGLSDEDRTKAERVLDADDVATGTTFWAASCKETSSNAAKRQHDLISAPVQ